MKMVMISYNEAIDVEMLEVLNSCGMKYYTKITGTFGSGQTSGVHLGTDIWPGRNNMLFIACDDKQAPVLMDRVKELRSSLGQEGVKAFVMPLDSLT